MYCSKILLCFLSIFWFLNPETKALNFNFTNLGPQNQNVDIAVFSASYISAQGLQVTSDDKEANLPQASGKATYVESLHLWDQSTRVLTDFYTHFVFVIDSNGQTPFADGITFFLVANDSYPGPAGQSIGLPATGANSTYPFVAVEFDTFQNFGVDPIGIIPDTHVGINVNSIISDVFSVWHCNVTQGIENEAWIRYDSSSHNLSVTFTGSTNMTTVQDTISLIVDLRDYLPEWVTIGFSAATGSYFEKNTVKSWEFSSSLGIAKTKKISIGAVVGLVFGSGVLVTGFLLVGFGIWKRSRAKEADEMEVEKAMEYEFESGAGPKKYAYGQLSRATNNFKHKLGEGGFGGVYRGFLGELNSYIAVKKISEGSKQGIKEYTTEVRIIRQLRHKNLVQLIGWCHESKHLLLVYEYMENGSLDLHLFKGKSLLTWATRYKIVQGLASALLYLHEEWEQCVVHRDIKSSNVMLDSNFNAKLGDFGLARFFDHEKEPQTTALAGTMGYLAPECSVTSKATKESDIYSFGVVLLEIACGRRPFDIDVPECQKGMVEWVWDLFGMGRFLEAADLKLGQDFDEREMERLIIVGLWCAHPDHNSRPKIREAIHVLNFEAPLPTLPQKQPALWGLPLPLDPTNSDQDNYSSYTFTYNVAKSQKHVEFSSYWS